jgi:hypothetical protein
MSELCIMDASGDLKKIWDPTKPDEVADARRSFDEMQKKGYAAYKVDDKGDRGEVIREFDPGAGKIIMAPQMRGG